MADKETKPEAENSTPPERTVWGSISHRFHIVDRTVRDGVVGLGALAIGGTINVANNMPKLFGGDSISQYVAGKDIAPVAAIQKWYAKVEDRREKEEGIDSKNDGSVGDMVAAGFGHAVTFLLAPPVSKTAVVAEEVAALTAKAGVGAVAKGAVEATAENLGKVTLRQAYEAGMPIAKEAVEAGAQTVAKAAAPEMAGKAAEVAAEGASYLGKAWNWALRKANPFEGLRTPYAQAVGNGMRPSRLNPLNWISSSNKINVARYSEAELKAAVKAGTILPPKAEWTLMIWSKTLAVKYALAAGAERVVTGENEVTGAVAGVVGGVAWEGGKKVGGAALEGAGDLGKTALVWSVNGAADALGVPKTLNILGSPISLRAKTPAEIKEEEEAAKKAKEAGLPPPERTPGILDALTGADSMTAGAGLIALWSYMTGNGKGPLDSVAPYVLLFVAAKMLDDYLGKPVQSYMKTAFSGAAQGITEPERKPEAAPVRAADNRPLSPGWVPPKLVYGS